MTGPGPQDFPPLGPLDGAGQGAVAALILRDREGRILLQLRDDRPGVAFGGHWGLFGGAVEKGETLTEAACREIAEELGVSLDPARLVPHGVILSSSPHRARIFFLRSTQPVSPGEIRLGEGAGFGFFTDAQVPALRLVPSLRPALARLDDGNCAEARRTE